MRWVDMKTVPPQRDGRSVRSWIMAFQAGFKRTTVGIEAAPDDLVGLLELADLRLAGDQLVSSLGRDEERT